ncbi:S-adenosyl-L-methionine-dependent methyltransferase [Thozetella sp. PMI_491]|nr:S-adenosyl-L-methionine-dependent methyltransferase [Thozetella sp. PMI_491]
MDPSPGANAPKGPPAEPALSEGSPTDWDLEHRIIEAEEGPIDEDEFIAEAWNGNTSDSTSVSSSVYAHTYEHGRRYHKFRAGRYPIPNDDDEQNRQDMMHAMVLELTDGCLFYAPIGEHPQKIIDLGTGTGIWAMEIGDKYPSAEVLGLDLSPIQTIWVPPNVKFLVDDVEDDWLNGSDWDFAHFRGMANTLRDLDRMAEQTFKHLRPGGWVEFQEIYGKPLCDDGTMGDDDIMKQYYEVSVKAMGQFGIDLSQGSKVGEYLERAGFQNINCVVKKMPLGTWARDKRMRLIGLYVADLILTSLPSMVDGKPFARLGLSEEERMVWGARVREAIKEPHVHRYYHHYFWFAQKPGQ